MARYSADTALDDVFRDVGANGVRHILISHQIVQGLQSSGADCACIDRASSFFDRHTKIAHDQIELPEITNKNVDRRLSAAALDAG